MMTEHACELCHSVGGDLLWADGRCRVVRVTGADGDAFPGFCRVIWQDHVVEMSDLTDADASHLMAVVRATEHTVRQQVAPDKINLASLGNLTPHVHWHVIPRWRNDSHFPSPIWAAPQRANPMRAAPATSELVAALHIQLSSRSPCA